MSCGELHDSTVSHARLCMLLMLVWTDCGGALRISYAYCTSTAAKLRARQQPAGSAAGVVVFCTVPYGSIVIVLVLMRVPVPVFYSVLRDYRSKGCFRYE